MKNFKVTNIIDGDTFDVSPNWNWNGQSGSRIRAAGYDAPEIDTAEGRRAKEKLERLISGQTVQVGTAHKIDRGRLVCEVYYNGRNLAEYFTEYQ